MPRIAFRDRNAARNQETHRARAEEISRVPHGCAHHELAISPGLELALLEELEQPGLARQHFVILRRQPGDHPLALDADDAGRMIAREVRAQARDAAILRASHDLLQLLEEGKLEPGRNGELVVRAPMRYPADLFGASSMRFLVPRGVPVPEGDPGHSCVMSEETGRAISKTSCE